MSKGDQLVERGAQRLEELAAKFAAEEGVKAKLAEPLADDAAFLRQLKPSLIKARARGELPKDQPPGSTPAAPVAPQLGPRAAKGKGGGTGGKGGGPNPFVVVGAALAIGIFLAKWIDWRGHAHPRD